MLPVMLACVWIGVPREPVNADLLRDHDWPGVAYAASGFGLLYAGLDQGNRLDWTGSGLVVGLLAAGALLVAVFAVRELGNRRPFFDLRLFARGNLMILILLLACFRFIILSTAYIIPTYLQVVQNFRELQVGPVLLFIALPQILLVLPLGWLLARIDGRRVLAGGALFIGVACLQATSLTAEWATWDFLPSQAFQAIGQSLALTALVVLAVREITPASAMSIGALIQVGRLLGGEVGTAFMQTFVRIREQVHSNLLGLHVDPALPATAERIDLYQATVGDAANGLLGLAVARQASVLAYIDGFAAAAAGAFLCILLAGWLTPGIKRG
jgi:DHA2 family multidrug resistance protein